MANAIYDNDPGGILTALPDGALPDYDIRAAIAYCEKKGIDIADLSPVELREFELRQTSAA